MLLEEGLRLQLEEDWWMLLIQWIGWLEVESALEGLKCIDGYSIHIM